MSPSTKPLGPFDHGRHRRKDRLDIAAGLEAEDRASVVEQVELDIAATAHELLFAFRLAPRRRHVAPDQLRINVAEGAPNLLGESEIRVPIAAIQIIVED